MSLLRMLPRPSLPMAFIRLLQRALSLCSAHREPASRQSRGGDSGRSGRQNQALEQTRDRVLRYGEPVGRELLNFVVRRIGPLMKLIGRFAPSTRSDLLLGWIGLAFVGAFIAPWIAIAIGCVIIGVGGIFRGERALIVCFPAGLALLLLPALLFWLDRRWYSPISQFALDDNMLTYTLARKSVTASRLIDDVRWVEHRMHRGYTRGYLVKFTDGSGIFVCRSLSSADELAIALKNAVKHRSTTLA